VSLPVALSSAGLARGFVQDCWCTEHDSADLVQAQLIVTELVTNAVRHGGPPIELQIECLTTGGVLLSVSDGSLEPPAAQESGPDRWGGRGVQLVDLLSAEWGVHQDHHFQHSHFQHHREHVRQPDHNHDHDHGRELDDRVDRLHPSASTPIQAAPADQPDANAKADAKVDADTDADATDSAAGGAAKTVWCRLVA
jgi:hypothetical protein